MVTGNRGKIGRVVEELLRQRGFEVVGFDRSDGMHLEKPRQIHRAVSGCDLVVHLASLGVTERNARRLFAANVLGTWNLLSAAADAGVRRVVYLSSVNALGIFRGDGLPDYLPIDDQHPARPRSPYGLTKLLAEEACAYFTRTQDIVTVCLRPPAVLGPADYRRMLGRRQQDSADEWRPFWEYGAFLDVRDMAEAVGCGLTAPISGHLRLLLCAEDIGSSHQGRELAARLLPQVPWRDDSGDQPNPKASLVDCKPARQVLNWTPRHTWQEATAEYGSVKYGVLPPAVHRAARRALRLLRGYLGLAGSSERP